MPSSFGLFFILFGGLLMGIGYEIVSQCSSMYTNCWDPFARGVASPGAFGFYVGAFFAGVGIVILGGGEIANLLRK